MKRIILLSLALGACAPKGYLGNPDVSYEQDQKDRTECRYEAAKATAGIREAFDRRWDENKLTDQCLSMKGYRWVTTGG